MRTAGTAETTDDRAALIQQAFRLEYLTLAWMAIEAVVATGTGVAADSLTLTAFGIDSLIELASAVVRAAPVRANTNIEDANHTDESKRMPPALISTPISMIRGPPERKSANPSY
jgi:hypothetical protein